MSRESSFSSAGKACSQLESAGDELKAAINRVDSQIGTVEFYWQGASGSAMHEALTAWTNKANSLSQRIDSLASQMRSSQLYDYKLWPEEE